MKELRKEKIRNELIGDRCRLLSRMPFLGYLAMHLDLVPVSDPRLKTACTDGTHLYVDMDFYEGLSPEKRLSAVAHEVWHCALGHLNRYGDRECERFNCACDYEVNALLKQYGMDVSGMLYNARWDGMSAEEIYNLLPPHPQRPPDSDRHWAARENQQDAPNKEKNTSSDGTSSDGKSSDGKSSDGKSDPDFQPGVDPSVTERWKNYLEDALKQDARNFGRKAGRLSANLKRLIERVTSRETLDWKQLLLDYTTQIFSMKREWLPPARRHVWAGLYLPGHPRQKMIEIVVAVDTSGSTTEDLPDFLKELQRMTSAFGEYRITLIQCDYTIKSVEEYTNERPLPEHGLQFRGFGGTSLVPPFEYVEKEKIEPTVMIYLTDGCGDAPRDAPNYPVIWCITHDGRKPASWGVSVKIQKIKELILVCHLVAEVMAYNMNKGTKTVGEKLDENNLRCNASNSEKTAQSG